MQSPRGWIVPEHLTSRAVSQQRERQEHNKTNISVCHPFSWLPARWRLLPLRVSQRLCSTCDPLLVVFTHSHAGPQGSRHSGPKSVAGFTCQQQPCPRPARHHRPAAPASCALLPGGARNPNKSQGEHTRDKPQVGDARNQRAQGCVTGARASPAPGTSPHPQGPAAPHTAARLIRQSLRIPLHPKASRATHGESAAV